MTDQRRKLTSGLGILFILAAVGLWLWQNGLLPGSADLDEAASLHNHPTFSYREAGLGIDMDVTTALVEGGTKATISFLVTDLGTGQARTELEISHGQPMHVVGIRQGDLNQFLHIHPKLAGERWVVEHVFAEAGAYSLWPGIAMGNSVIAERMPDIVIGQPQDLVSAPDFFRTKSPSGNLEVHLDAPSQLKAGKTYRLPFTVTDSVGRTIALGKYLEENLHVNIVSQDLAQYHHLHASYGMINPKDPDSLELAFSFPVPGEYKMFVEFVTLDNPQTVRLVEYWFDVRP